MAAQYSYGHRLPYRDHQQRPRPAAGHDEKQLLLATGVYRHGRQPSPITTNANQCSCTQYCKPQNYRAPSPPRILIRQPSQRQARNADETYQLRSPPPQYQSISSFPQKQAEFGDDMFDATTPPPQYQPAFPLPQQQSESKPSRQSPPQKPHPPLTHREQQQCLNKEQRRPPVTHSTSEPQVGYQQHATHNNIGHRPPAMNSKSEPPLRQAKPNYPNLHLRQSFKQTEVAQPVSQQAQRTEQQSQPPRPKARSFHAQFVSLPMFTLFTHHEAAVQAAKVKEYMGFKKALEKETTLSEKAGLFMMDMVSGSPFIGLEDMARGIGKLHEQAAKLGCKEIATVVVTRWAWTGKRAGGKMGTLLVDVLEYRWKANMTPIRVKCSATETVKIILCETKEAKIKEGKCYNKESNFSHVEKVAMIDADGKAQAMEMIVRGQCGCSAVEWNEMKERFQYGWHVPRIGW